jgi:hypothetical protein
MMLKLSRLAVDCGVVSHLFVLARGARCEHAEMRECFVLKFWQDHRESHVSPLIFPKSKLNVYFQGANSYVSIC